MGQPKLTITIQSGGLSRKNPDENNISGLLCFNSIMPSSGWTVSGNTVMLKSVSEAEKTYGILSTGNHSVEHFQITEFFNAAPNSTLYLGIYPSGSTSFSEITLMQNKAQGKLRRLGIQMLSETGTTTMVGTIQTICNNLYNDNKPLYVILAPNSYTLDLTTAPSLRALNSKYVGVFIGQDNTGRGWELATGKTYSVTALGKLLGFNSAAPVNVNVGWIGQYNFQQGTENAGVNLGQSDFWNINTSTLDTLNDNGYMFLKKVTGLDGTYLNDMPACTSSTDDYAYLTDTNTIFKAVRGVRTFVLPLVNSPILLNSDGTIAQTNVTNFELTAGNPLLTMKENGEISDYKVFVDPDQEVLSTSTVNIVIGVLPTGTARWIEVSIGFVANIS